MRWILWLFDRIPLLTLEVEYDEVEYEEPDPGYMEAGSAHNFQIAANTETSEVSGEPWPEEKRQFGFDPGRW